MALRNILKEGDRGLLKKSRVVTGFNERLHILLDDMRETLTNAGGLGLAAPQVGVLRRAVLVVDLPEEEETDEADEFDTTDGSEGSDDTSSMYDDADIIELINPEIISREGEQCGSEGCLSLPGQYGMVTRPQTVVVRAQDRFGEYFEFEGSGMTARAICHEVDHLEGIIFKSIAQRMLSDEELEELHK